MKTVKSVGTELEKPIGRKFGPDNKAPFTVDLPFTKSPVLDEKGQPTGAIELRGYASTWVEDRDGEYVDPAAFDRSLANYLSKNPIVLWQHDMDKPIGTMKHAEVDQYGLTVLGDIPKPDQREPDWAHLAYNKISKGIVKTFSIGGYFHRDFVQGRSVIKEVELMEISVVSIPSNPDSIFEAAVKALEGGSRRPSLNPGHIRQMKQLLGMEVLSDPDLVVMTPDERVQRYEYLAAQYRKAGLRPPALDEWKQLEPRIYASRGEGAIGITDEIIGIMRKVNGGMIEIRRGRVISKDNEKQLRAALEILGNAEARIDHFADEAKKVVDDTRTQIDIVLKQVTEADESDDENPPAGDEEESEPQTEEDEEDGTS